MSSRFADTAYYLALINPSDVAHQLANDLTDKFDGILVTTSAVVNGLGNHLRIPANRALFAQLVRELQENPDVRFVHVDGQLFRAGIDLFEQRRDQEWSLTDCISFVVMQRHRLTEALTTDHHFEQAGFTALLKP